MRIFNRWLDSATEAIERLPWPLRPVAGIAFVTFVLGPIGVLAWLLVAEAVRVVYVALGGY